MNKSQKSQRHFSQRKLLLALLLIASPMFLAMSPAKVGNRYMIKITDQEFRDRQADIRKQGLDYAGVDLKNHFVYLLSRNADLVPLALHAQPVQQIFSSDRPDAKYKTSDQVATKLQGYAASFPDLAAVLPIGKSLEGRDILALKITGKVQTPNSRPAILFNGMHHAREVMSTEVPLDIADYLLTNYGKDASVTHWVDSTQIYIIPMLNVDGNHLVWTSDSMWRKNARDGVGVDINRNYPFAWNTCNGSSSNRNADDYRGPSAASEPETNALMNFVTQIHPVFDISFHSFGELVIYPYGCGSHTEPGTIVEPIGRAMADLITGDDGRSKYTAGIAPDLLYSVDGDDNDWMYHEQHVIAYTIEVNAGSQGFQPKYDRWRDSTVKRVRPAWQYLLNKMSSTLITGTAHASSIRIAEVNGRYSEDIRVNEDGTFHAVVNPGSYELSGPGRHAKIVTVVKTPVHVDF